MLNSLITFTDCNYVLTAQIGNYSIKSPNYPANYPFNLNCSWLITGGSSSSFVRVFFFAFSTVQDRDLVLFYDGASSGSAILANSSGLSLPTPNPIDSRSNEMFITFTTGNKYTFTGLAASHWVKDKY